MKKTKTTYLLIAVLLGSLAACNKMDDTTIAQSPQAYQEFLKAKNDNVDPNEYLNKIVNGFSPEKKEQWNAMMGQFQQPKK